MLLHYHWGQGVGHAYSHVTQTTIDSHGNPVSSPTDSCNLASDQGNRFESTDCQDRFFADLIFRGVRGSGHGLAVRPKGYVA